MFRFSIDQIEEYAFDKKEFLIDNDALENVSQSFHFLVEFSKNKIIYGINTGFGPMAQYKIDDSQLSINNFSFIHFQTEKYYFNNLVSNILCLTCILIFAA